MTAEDDAIASLSSSGMLDVLKWAAPAAFVATDQFFDEHAGHDQGVVGYLNYKHLKDLIDRATSNGRFALGQDVEGAGRDVVELGIAPETYKAMPVLTGDAVLRNDYHQSPGWAADGYRVLLQSYGYGGIDDIKWMRHSDAKRRVAAQIFAEQESLFDELDLGLELLAGIPDDDQFTGVTLVAAHAFNPVTKQYELYLGQSKNPAYPKDDCWHWKKLLMSGGTPLDGATRSTPPALPGDAASTNVDDVEVRMKPRTDEAPGTSHG